MASNTWSVAIRALLILIVYSVTVQASEVCVYGDRYKICDHGCCSNDCCLSPYQIAGIVFGALALICIIAAVVLYCVKRQKRKGRVIGDANTRVMMVNGYSQPVVYNTTQPFAPGYSSTYGHPGVPPPYGMNPDVAPPPPQYATAYGYGAYPGHPPPYSRVDASKNPFAAAAHTASHGAGAGAAGGSSNPGAA